MKEGLEDARGRQGYYELLAMRGSGSQKSVGDGRDGRTVLVKRLSATNDLCAISARLLDANSVLEMTSQVLLSKDSTLLQRKQSANSLRRLLVPLNLAASNLLHEAAKSTAPIGGCRKYHCRSETERKKTAEQQVQLHARMGHTNTVPVQRLTD